MVKITLIEAKGTERVAIWIDGYIPSLERLEPKLKARHCFEKSSYLESGWTQLDYMIRNFLCDSRLIFHRKASQKGKSELHLCDLFYSRAFSSTDIPIILKSIAPFYEDISNERAENYRQLIITYEPGLCSVGKDCTNNLIKELEFEIKKPESYKNYEEFKKACIAILDHVMEAYEAPCIVASERLKNLGFLAECDQS